MITTDAGSSSGPTARSSSVADFVRQNGKPFRFEFDRDWKAGPHTLTVEVQPLTPDEKQVRSLSLRIQSATLRGPMDERYWVRPPDYERFFPGEVPA